MKKPRTAEFTMSRDSAAASVPMIGSTSQLKMSSAEIASLTGKKLPNVHRDIRTMLAGLYGDGHPEFTQNDASSILSAIAGDDSILNHHDSRGFSWERDSRGYVVSFLLDRSHTLTLISGYSVRLRKAIIDRWEELEAAAQQPTCAIPQTLAQALRLAADIDEVRNRLLVVVDEQAEHIEALGRHFATGVTLPDWVKQLSGVNSQQINEWALEKKWIRKCGDRWRIAHRGRADLFVREIRLEYRCPITGEQRFYYKIEVLPAGGAAIYRAYVRGELPMLTGWDGEVSPAPLEMNCEGGR